MNLSIQTVPGPVVPTPPTTHTITLSGLTDGEVRRFHRIFAHAAKGQVYTGPLTTAFAQAVVESLGQ